MDEQFLYDFRTGCGNSAKFARIFDMGFITIYWLNHVQSRVKTPLERAFIKQKV